VILGYDVLIHPAYLFPNGPLWRELSRRLVFQVPGPGVCASPHQQPHRFHLRVVILQRADDVQRRVPTESLKPTEESQALFTPPPPLRI